MQLLFHHWPVKNWFKRSQQNDYLTILLLIGSTKLTIAFVLVIAGTEPAKLGIFISIEMRMSVIALEKSIY